MSIGIAGNGQSAFPREVVKVTRWKDDCVWETASKGYVWLNAKREWTSLEEVMVAKLHGGDYLTAVSTHDPRIHEFKARKGEMYYAD